MFFSGNEVAKGWQPLFKEFFATDKGVAILKKLRDFKDQGFVIYPPEPFRLFNLVSPEDVKVVILGQDPYHGHGQANGLAFSVFPEVKIPPSLKNIFAEIKAEYPEATFNSGSLENWACQGVALLNSILTVEDSKPASHKNLGWESLTDLLIEKLASEGNPKVFMLWGNFAQKKEELILATRRKHLILKSNHPSPLSARRGPIPFFGNNHFKMANEWLMESGLKPINWST